ncbi:MAG: type II toxin-antitoxin system HigB family toxin, partial [Hyphomicrobiales bacterium]
MSKARWTSAADVKRLYATASVITSERIVFNLQRQLIPSGSCGGFP